MVFLMSILYRVLACELDNWKRRTALNFRAYEDDLSARSLEVQGCLLHEIGSQDLQCFLLIMSDVVGWLLALAGVRRIVVLVVIDVPGQQLVALAGVCRIVISSCLLETVEQYMDMDISFFWRSQLNRIHPLFYESKLHQLLPGCQSVCQHD